jgi:flagellar biosynthesis component FlhA
VGAHGTGRRPRRGGYTVVDAVSVLGTHLAELIRRYAHELFSRQDAKKLLDRVALEHPKVVEDLVPKLLPLATVQRVLQNLLRERVSIRDAVTILEALGEAAVTTRNPVLLTEYVRQAHAAHRGEAVSEQAPANCRPGPGSRDGAGGGIAACNTESRTAI